MSLDDVRRVADAVLYEGYILYPYRASSQKNRSRWQFGVLMPPAYAAADASETWDEAVEREVSATVAGAALFGDGTATPFGIPGGEEHEATANGDVIRV